MAPTSRSSSCFLVFIRGTSWYSGSSVELPICWCAYESCIYVFFDLFIHSDKYTEFLIFDGCYSEKRAREALLDFGYRADPSGRWR